MTNPAAVTEGSAGLKLPLLVGSDGTAYLPAAGTAETMSGGWDNQRAPALVELNASPALGAITETAPATDTASSGLNGRLQRIAQRLTSLIALLPAALGAGGGLKVDGSGTDLPVSSTTLATAAKQPALGTAGTASADVITIQGKASMTAVLVDSELPAAAALADATANPTTPIVGSALHGFNGATWDRLRTPTTFKNFSGTVITSETTIWTPTGGKKFRLMGFVITQGVVTGDITVRDNTAGSTILTIPATPTGQPLTFAMGNGILSGAAGRLLTFQGASTETVSGFVYGTEE